MKSLRFTEEVVLDNHVASVLMLLSSGKRNEMGLEVVGTGPDSGPVPTRVFECKTCSRQFSSFQALGGHRASHKKPKADGGADDGPAHERPKVHACTVCGLEFTVGQALGGHMRRHRPGWAGPVGLKELKEEKKVLLDLNSSPSPSWGGGDEDFHAE